MSLVRLEKSLEQKDESKYEASTSNPKKKTSPCHSVTQFFSNLSSYSPTIFITGNRFNHIPRIKGGVCGQFFNTIEKDGKGFGELLDRAAEIAESHPRGMCYFWMGHQFCLLITRPQDIQQLILHNNKNIANYDIMGSFKKVFGAKNIFGLPVGPEWRVLRSRFQKWLYNDDALTEVTPAIQKILDYYYQAITSEHKEIDLETLVSRFTMDAISSTRLGLDIDEHIKDNVSINLTEAMRELSNPLSYLPQRIANVICYFKKFKLNTNEILEHGRKMFKQEVLTTSVNKDSLANNQNWLNDLAKRENLDYDADELINETIMFLAVGHETTAKLLQNAIMLISEHENVREQLKKEIAARTLNIKDIKFDELEKMHYLDAILNETLRLYPPVPIQKEQVLKPMVLADIERCDKREQYFAAMNERKISEDVPLKAGDKIFLHLEHTQRKFFENGEQFQPERWIDKPQADPYAFFPFGFTPRICVGMRFAFLETKLALIKWFSAFNIKTNTKHPYKVDKIFTSKLSEKVPTVFERVGEVKSQIVEEKRFVTEGNLVSRASM